MKVRHMNQGLHTVRRDGDLDLQFSGTILSRATSQVFSEPKDRWMEVVIYATNDGRYVVSTVGRTVVEGEDDRWSSVVCDTPDDVVDALTHDEMACDECGQTAKVQCQCGCTDLKATGVAYIPRTSRRALDRAREIDDAFSHALVERIA